MNSEKLWFILILKNLLGTFTISYDYSFRRSNNFAMKLSILL